MRKDLGRLLKRRIRAKQHPFQSYTACVTTYCKASIIVKWTSTHSEQMKADSFAGKRMSVWRNHVSFGKTWVAVPNVFSPETPRRCIGLQRGNLCESLLISWRILMGKKRVASSPHFASQKRPQGPQGLQGPQYFSTVRENLESFWMPWMAASRSSPRCWVPFTSMIRSFSPTASPECVVFHVETRPLPTSPTTAPNDADPKFNFRPELVVLDKDSSTFLGRNTVRATSPSTFSSAIISEASLLLTPLMDVMTSKSLRAVPGWSSLKTWTAPVFETSLIIGPSSQAWSSSKPRLEKPFTGTTTEKEPKAGAGGASFSTFICISAGAVSMAFSTSFASAVSRTERCWISGISGTFSPSSLATQQQSMPGEGW